MIKWAMALGRITPLRQFPAELMHKSFLQMRGKFIPPLPALPHPQEFRAAGFATLQKRFLLAREGLVFHRGRNFVRRSLQSEMAQDARALLLRLREQIFVAH